MKKDQVLQNIKKSVNSIEPSAEVILFGSRVKKKHSKDSDWDILILTEENTSLAREKLFRDKLVELEIDFETSISVFLYSKSDWYNKIFKSPLYSAIYKEGMKI